MSAGAQSRREALRRAALGAGALAAAGLVRPAAARGPIPRRRGPARLPRRGDLARAAHRARLLDRGKRRRHRPAADAGAASATRSRRTRPRCATALDSLGFDLPTPPDSTTDDAAFDDVDGLDTDASQNLIDLLGELDGLKSPREYFEYLVKLESEQLALYASQGAEVDSVDLLDDERRDRRLPGPAPGRARRPARRARRGGGSRAATAAADAVPSGSA